MTVGIHTEVVWGVGWANRPALDLLGRISPSPNVSGVGLLGPYQFGSFAIEGFSPKVLSKAVRLSGIVWCSGDHEDAPDGGACRNGREWGVSPVPAGFGEGAPKEGVSVEHSGNTSHFECATSCCSISRVSTPEKDAMSFTQAFAAKQICQPQSSQCVDGWFMTERSRCSLAGEDANVIQVGPKIGDCNFALRQPVDAYGDIDRNAVTGFQLGNLPFGGQAQALAQISLSPAAINSPCAEL